MQYLDNIHIKLLPKAITVLLLSIALIVTSSMLYWALSIKLGRGAVDKSNITAQQRERELVCLAKNIYYEAGNEPFEGKVAVAQVTLNRAQHEDFPNDICKVVYQKNIFYAKTVCQFSWYCDRQALMRPMDSESYQESMIVAKKVLLEGFRLPSLHDALFYHANYVNPNWKKKRIVQVGKHIFYE